MRINYVHSGLRTVVDKVRRFTKLGERHRPSGRVGHLRPYGHETVEPAERQCCAQDGVVIPLALGSPRQDTHEFRRR